jgi:hypothetical protein
MKISATILHFLVLMQALSISTLSTAQVGIIATKSAPRYCGSGLTEYVVPDKLFDCDMSAACNTHDQCYAHCDLGHAGYGTVYCSQPESSPERMASKRRCDAQLEVDILRNNPGKSICEKVGAFYRLAVKALGQGPFNGRLAPDGLSQLVVESNTVEEAAAKLNTVHMLAYSNTVDLNQTWVNGSTLVIPTKKPIGPSPLLRNGVIELRKGDKISDLNKLQRDRLAKTR